MMDFSKGAVNDYMTQAFNAILKHHEQVIKAILRIHVRGMLSTRIN